MLRDVRSVLRTAVDFGGLTPRSHRDEFLGEFVPVYSFVCTGPPMVRLAQTRALLEAGVLTLAGPRTRFGAGDDHFLLDSPQVNSPARAVDILFDARTPVADLPADTSGLSRRLRARGVLTTYTNASGGSAFTTGGVTVTSSPFHPVGLNGPDPTLYLIGIPSEGTRWLPRSAAAAPRCGAGSPPTPTRSQPTFWPPRRCREPTSRRNGQHCSSLAARHEKPGAPANRNTLPHRTARTETRRPDAPWRRQAHRRRQPDSSPEPPSGPPSDGNGPYLTRGTPVMIVDTAPPPSPVTQPARALPLGAHGPHPCHQGGGVRPPTACRAVIYHWPRSGV